MKFVKSAAPSATSPNALGERIEIWETQFLKNPQWPKKNSRTQRDWRANRVIQAGICVGKVH
jgi:hypothetical protein